MPRGIKKSDEGKEGVDFSVTDAYKRLTKYKKDRFKALEDAGKVNPVDKLNEDMNKDEFDDIFYGD